jgi:hypothetical protein
MIELNVVPSGRIFFEKFVKKTVLFWKFLKTKISVSYEG